MRYISLLQCQGIYVNKLQSAFPEDLSKLFPCPIMFLEILLSHLLQFQINALIRILVNTVRIILMKVISYRYYKPVFLRH